MCRHDSKTAMPNVIIATNKFKLWEKKGWFILLAERNLSADFFLVLFFQPQIGNRYTETEEAG